MISEFKTAFRLQSSKLGRIFQDSFQKVRISFRPLLKIDSQSKYLPLLKLSENFRTRFKNTFQNHSENLRTKINHCSKSSWNFSEAFSKVISELKKDFRFQNSKRGKIFHSVFQLFGMSFRSLLEIKIFPPKKIPEYIFKTNLKVYREILSSEFSYR